jgi:hypothetical protein
LFVRRKTAGESRLGGFERREAWHRSGGMTMSEVRHHAADAVAPR